VLAAPAADAVIADCGHLDVSDDQTLLDPDLFCPGLRNIDSFEGAAILAAPHPLLLRDVAQGFPTSRLLSSYRISGAKKTISVKARRWNDDDVVKFMAAHVVKETY
jgi:hypothetical protein